MVIAVQVQDENLVDDTVSQMPVDDPSGYLQDLEQYLEAEEFATVQLPGQKGDWVLWLTPESRL